MCGTFFPFGTAYSSRVLHFAKLFKEAGYDVVVLALFSKSNTSNSDYEIFENIKYRILCKNKSRIGIFKKHKLILEAIKNEIANTSTIINQFLFLNGSDPVLYKKIKSRFHTNFVFESCEWYDVSSYKLGFFDIRYHLFQNSIKHEYIKNNKIIAISSFLKNYYLAKNPNANVVFIPTILDLTTTHFSFYSNEEKIHFMFAGTFGGNKELFDEFLSAISEFSSDKISVDIYGCKEDLFYKIIRDKNVAKKVQDMITCHGFVEQSTIANEYCKADFSIIFRPNRRSSNAGFPTKLAESMACGTPVIANNTGDIGLFIKDGFNGFVVNNKKDDIYNLICKILEMKTEDRINMKKNARKTAESFFDYKRYIESITELLK